MNEDPSISPEESGRNSESEEEKFEEPPEADGMAENAETENYEKEGFEPPDIKVEDVAENVETENCLEKLKSFSEGPLGIGD